MNNLILFQIACDSFRVLVAHFEDIMSPQRVSKPTPKVRGRAHKVLAYFKQTENVLFMAFMADAIQHLADLSKAFQYDAVTPSGAIDALERCVILLFNSVILLFNSVVHNM